MKGCCIVCLLGLVFVMVIYSLSGVKTELFTEGLGLLPAPVGGLVAVKKGTNKWAVHEESGRRIVEFSANSPPLWIKDGRGRSLVFMDRQSVWKLDVDNEPEPNRLLRKENGHLIQAIPGGKILLSLQNENRVNGFSLIQVNEITSNGEPHQITHRFEKGNAFYLKVSPDGRRISYSVHDSTFFRINVLLKEDEGDTFKRDHIIEDANYAEHFWSPSGRYLAFSSSDGGIEVYDFVNRKKCWLAESSFKPSSLLPYSLVFNPSETWLFTEIIDDYGYRQVTRLFPASGEESRFSLGWLDHYGPVATGDDRFLAYRQGELPSEERRIYDWDEEEAVYLFDLIEDESYHLCNRTMRVGSVLIGPKFSGDNCFVYFELEGKILRYRLPE